MKEQLHTKIPTNRKQEFLLGTKVIICTALFLFASSLMLTSLFTSGDDIRGYWLLIMGWAGLIIFQFSWFANPINLLALLLLQQQPKLALLLSFVALIFASQSFFLSEIPTGIRHGKIFIKEFGLGFYLWYLSQSLFFLGILVEVIVGHKKTGTSPVFT